MVECTIVLSAQKPKPQEYQIKAAFLFNFTQFIEWPSDVLPQDNSPLIIGILGKDPFNTYLDDIIAGERVLGHPLIIKRYRSVEEVNCHVLFINPDNPKELKQILTRLKGRNILTIGDTDDFIEKGGMVRFIKVNQKIQFQINPEAAKKADLTVSSKVLRLAEIVVPNKKQ